MKNNKNHLERNIFKFTYQYLVKITCYKVIINAKILLGDNV